jgi:hypothetical protein
MALRRLQEDNSVTRGGPKGAEAATLQIVLGGCRG